MTRGAWPLGFVLVVAALACKKPSPSANPSEAAVEQQAELSEAHAFFVQTTFPHLEACVGCHAPGGAGSPFFVAGDAETSYQNIQSNFVGLIADPTQSPLVQHVHSDTTIVIKIDVKNVLIAWLRREVNARGLPGSVPVPKTAAEAYAQLKACTTLSLWNQYNVTQVARISTTTDAGLCMGCHKFGQGGFFAHADARDMFTASMSFPYVQKYLQAQFDANGDFKQFVLASRLVQKSMEQCLDPDTNRCHPGFVVPEEAVASINGFFKAAADNLAFGLCGAFSLQALDAGTDASEGGM
jgi:hypothetical protein